jgi:2,3-diketo-5-methylthio-1-phosphopentane phosphatase
MTVRLFVDFDGTVTREDVGNAFFREFGGEDCDECVRSYRAGDISAVECYAREAAATGEFDQKDAERFVRAQTIDPTFSAFLMFSRERGYQVTIVSDGLDFYIREILDTNGLRVPFFANESAFLPGKGPGKVTLSLGFPFADSDCTRCACCKRNIMLSRSGDQDLIVLIGEGYSDTCPARYADIVFAKKELQRFCQAENISYFPYLDFSDVVRKLEALTAKGKPLRRRARAALNRRAAFKEE